jgi:hypothetical protein
VEDRELPATTPLHVLWYFEPFLGRGSKDGSCDGIGVYDVPDRYGDVTGFYVCVEHVRSACSGTRTVRFLLT